jgi:NAD+ synthase (glutamine-hydrolysing)
MKIALAQLNYHIGNFTDNTTKIAFEIKRAQQNGVDLIVFSELSVCGYPPLDLLEHRDFVNESLATVKNIARICTDIGVIVGSPTYNPNQQGKPLFNSAYFLYDGEIQHVVHKTLLPTYDIFDEYRYFEPNNDFEVIEFKGKRIALTICEDLWYNQPAPTPFGRTMLYTVSPMEELAKQKPDFVVNIAASPFSYTRVNIKSKIFTENARKYALPVFYVNQVGAQTELVFDGGSKVVDHTGEVVDEMSTFAEDIRYYDLDTVLNRTYGKKEFVNQDITGRIHDALILGIRDYFFKMGFSKAVLGLSGGIDSAVTLALAVQALGNENLRVLLLPSMYSTEHSLSDAEEIAENLGVQYDIVPIKSIFEAFKQELDPLFEGLPEDITEENIQARIRGVMLMAVSNKFGNILLNTSNKSEAAVGYGTLYGDMNGGLSVLGDVYKTDVYKLAEYINREQEIIPQNTITKPPSAELRPDQKDSDSLPDYEVLDKILFQYIEKQHTIIEITESGIEEKLVREIITKVNRNEYKRYQTPPILRISSKAFGPGRRMPLVAKF